MKTTVSNLINVRGILKRLDPSGKVVEPSRLTAMTFEELTQMKVQLETIGKKAMQAEDYERMPLIDTAYKIVDTLLETYTRATFGLL